MKRTEEGYRETTEGARSLESCRVQQKQAQEALNRAEGELKTFINHTLEQRIDLYQKEVDKLEIELVEVHASERAYTDELLNDPGAARRRLDRMAWGYSGEQAEFDAQQLDKLRQLRSQVESIKSKILSRQRDIQRIRELTAQREKESQIRATVNEVLLEFDSACSEFAEAWKKLKTIASENNVQLSQLQIPAGAKFEQSDNAYQPSVIKLVYGD